MIGAVRRRPEETAEHSVGELVKQASEELSQLVRQEMRLAQAEMAEKGKRASLSGGLFGVAAAVAGIAVLVLVGAAVAALALVLPVWAAALVLAGALLGAAGILALVGRAQLGRAQPPTPARTISSARTDMAELRERAHR